MTTVVSLRMKTALYSRNKNKRDEARNFLFFFLKKKQNVPLVGCRANEIENLLTAEPRVVSKKEKNRYLKFVTATKRGTF